MSSPAFSALGDAEPLLRLALAASLGAVVGLERGIRGRDAGVRTNTLVALAAAVFTLVGNQVHAAGPVDPTRIAAQVVSGIGFLGAGVIYRQGFGVKGLTSAATLWTVAALGMAAASGLYAIAVGALIIALLVNGPVRWLSLRLKPDTTARITVALAADADRDLVLAAVEEVGVAIRGFLSEGPDTLVLHPTRGRRGIGAVGITRRLVRVPGVLGVEVRGLPDGRAHRRRHL